jgi:hypothetical protein
MEKSESALPHPAFGHLLPWEETGKGQMTVFSRVFPREKVPEGRMRENTRDFCSPYGPI